MVIPSRLSFFLALLTFCLSLRTMAMSALSMASCLRLVLYWLSSWSGFAPNLPASLGLRCFSSHRPRCSSSLAMTSRPSSFVARIPALSAIPSSLGSSAAHEFFRSSMWSLIESSYSGWRCLGSNVSLGPLGSLSLSMVTAAARKGYCLGSGPNSAPSKPWPTDQAWVFASQASCAFSVPGCSS